MEEGVEELELVERGSGGLWLGEAMELAALEKKAS